MSDTLVFEVVELTDLIRPMLAGRDPAVQGAVLCDLLAIWLASHVIPGDRAATRAAREELLREHLESLWQLVDENAAHLGTNP